MAYSRFGPNSVWYTFWTALPSSKTTFKLPTKDLKYNQYFEICDFPQSYFISYGDLKKKGLKQVVKEVQIFYKDKKCELGDYTKLRWYLIQFMDDVNDHFKWYNFLKWEWFYPIRNRFLRFYNKIKLKR